LFFFVCFTITTTKYRGREGCCTFSLSLVYRLSQTVCNFHVILLRLMLPRDHSHRNRRCQAPCGSCKMLLITLLYCCYIFIWSFWNTFKYYTSSTAMGREGCSHVQTNSNRVCNFHVILLQLKLAWDHSFSRSLYYSKHLIAFVLL
jgi:hypothetical protein